MIWMSDDFDFSLDDLLVDDQEVPPPVVLPVSVIVSETEYGEQTEEPKALREIIEKQLVNSYAFAKPERRHYKEGFLALELAENVIKCIYARETPARIDFELDDLKIHTRRIRHINPSYRAKITISIEKTKARVVIFGGDEKIVGKALGLVNVCIRKCVKGGHKTYETGFSQSEMEVMLGNFGTDIQYVYIDPGENEKLRKMVEQKEKGETKKIPIYSVYTKFAGHRIIVSPVVLELIKQEGIKIREIEGRLNFAGGVSITSRISVSGRILFYVPDSLIGKTESAYDVAERLYRRIITQRTGSKQITMEEYFPGAA
jgi:hypothetical protein